MRERCKSLAQFVREGWHVLEPSQRLHWGMPQEAICLHLEAITHGTFLRMGYRNRLLINVPPGSMKSLLVSVFWEAWEWSLGLSSTRYVATSYGPGPVSRDNLKFQMLVTSEWYQRHWPIGFVRNATNDIVNHRTGGRQSAPFDSITSLRGDRFAVDDPHSTVSAESDDVRNKTTQQFREGAINRLNNQEVSAIIVIMQRLHANDLSGVILREMQGYIHLCLPMEFEAERRCVTPIWQDPRQHEGELLDPVRFPREAVDLLKVEMGSYGWAGQYQQRPSPREGNMFKLAWFADKIVKVAPAGTRWVRHWDLAASKEAGSARTAGVKIGKMPDGRYIVGDSKVIREEGNTVRMTIKATAALEPDVAISLPQDPGQAGKVQAKDMVLMLAGYRVRAMPESGEKTTRAEPFANQCEAGNVLILEGPWNQAYLDELCTFPSGQYADQVDASSGAFGQLVMQQGAVISGPIVVTAARSSFGDHPGLGG